MTGKLRPDFLSRCQPNESNVCTDPGNNTKEGRLSFPSGHSSQGFAGLSYLSYYVAGQLHVFARKGYTYKLYLVGIFPLVAALISITRISDYRHHWEDVLVGALMGIFMSYFCYRFYFPKLSDPKCHLPNDDRTGPEVTHDEENPQ